MTTTRIGLGLRICLGLAIALLALGVYAGVNDAPHNLRGARNSSQLVVGIAQVVYGASAVAALVGLWRRHSWTIPAAVLWALASTTAAGFATVAWAEVPITVPLAAALGTAVVTALCVWCIARYLRAVRQ